MQVFSNNTNSKSVVRFALKLIISSVLFGYCISLVNINDLYEIFLNVNAFHFVSAIGLVMIGTVFCKSYMVWKILIRREAIKFKKILAINFSMRFYTMFLPKALVALIRWNKYRIISEPKYAFVLVSFEAIVALTFASLMTFIFIIIEGNSLAPLWIMVTSIVTFLLFSIIIYVFFISMEGNLFRVFGNIACKILFFIDCKKIILKWKEAAELLGAGKKENMKIIILSSMLGHIIFLFGGYQLFLSMGIDINFIVLAWIRSFVFILVSIPISLAGIGVREVSFISLFGMYGYSNDYIVSYALLALFIQLIIGMMGMIVEINSLFNNKRNLG